MSAFFYCKHPTCQGKDSVFLMFDTENSTDTGSADNLSDAPDISVQADAPAESDAPETSDDFAELDADAIFGLPKETVNSDEDTTDETVVTDPPASRQSAEVTKEEAADEKPVADAEPTETDDTTVKFNEKLNWDDDKVPFRKEFKELKDAYLQLAKSDVATSFVSQPDKFAEWMRETSPTSYNEIGTILATESAKANPKQWLEFFAETNPDLMAQIATGRADLTRDRLLAELAYINPDEDEEDIQAKLAEAEPKPEAAETPEQKEIRELREWREQQQREQESAAVAQVRDTVFQPIEQEVNRLVSEAGLEIKDSAFESQNFAELDEDTQFKVMVNRMLPVWIDYRIAQDARLKSMQSRLEEFVNKRDAKSAANLLHPARIAVTNFTNEFLSVVTGQKAKSKAKELEIPTKPAPKPVIKSAANISGAAFGNDSGAIDWGVSEADLFGK